MSATTTTRTQTTAPLAILADYEVHHSGRDQTAPANSDRSPTSTNQPPGWPTDRHRVPTYRPINRDLDQSERPAGSNTLEFGIIIVMLHGVWLNAVTSRVWRSTGRRLNDRLFHYEIGGEW